MRGTCLSYYASAPNIDKPTVPIGATSVMTYGVPTVDDDTLLCPKCGGNYLHHMAIEVFKRDEDAKDGLHVLIHGSVVTIKHDEMRANPSSRRDGLTIGFYCELCGAESVLKLAQHKGQTITTWK